MSYPESVRYLYSLGNELKAGAKFGLERMQTLVAALGHPETTVPCIHIAGTNGKGSTAAMLASIFQAGRHRTGLYTSPHLVTPTERIQIDAEPVSPEDFSAAFDQVHCAAEALLSQDRLDAHPSYFETVTAMAFLLFRERCERAVYEVGLGGRLDATNVVSPELCVITPVSYDHESFLGNRIESIAGEKAGILKPGVPVVLARQNPEAEAVILERARELDCPVTRAADYQPANVRLTPREISFDLYGDPFTCELPGRHQVENALTAILAARQLGIPIAAIQTGLQRARWPGRLERLSTEPDFILDGAHNPAGAGALASYIREFYAGRPVWLVYGAMRDKAIDEVTAQLFPLADRLIVTAPDFPRALRPEAILEVAGHPNATIAPSVPAALTMARNAPREAAVFFTGSLFLVGEVRGLLLGSHPALP
ncbi:MAG TPA: folylpolyglutamate synthase/dihydrofolate synthase family protein [Bryobacteraceae bacterium]|nr:folylpolyglutamate synthase/dihydrofolate synthase family protein [Bryobacteraceae bacterium]